MIFTTLVEQQRVEFSIAFKLKEEYLNYKIISITSITFIKGFITFKWKKNYLNYKIIFYMISISFQKKVI